MQNQAKHQWFPQQPTPDRVQNGWLAARPSSGRLKPRYCYWSVADGPYGAMMEHCVRTARAAGVFQEFHTLTDHPIDGCECYDAYQCEKAHGLFKLHYLKAGMSRLNFDYFVWIDADTVFARNPLDVFRPLGQSPIHVPLEVNLSALETDTSWKGVLTHQLRKVIRDQGISNQVYMCGSAFWIIHHDAIESVYNLAFGFWHKAKEAGLVVDVSATLGYAMQMLCADPEAHLLKNSPDLWAGDDAGEFRDALPDGATWSWRHPLGSESIEVRPALVHLPNSKNLLGACLREPG